MKTRQENDLINRLGTIYAKNYTKLLRAIGPRVVYTKIRQKNDVNDLTGPIYIEK